MQVTERLDKEQPEQLQKQQLLLLEKRRIQEMSALAQKQRLTREFVDRYRQQKEKLFVVGKPVLAF